MAVITLKGREIPLLYTTYEMKEIQEELGPISKAIRIAVGRNPEDEEDSSPYGGTEHLKAVATLIRILGNAGLEEAGESPDLTDKKILRALRPAELLKAINTCVDAMNEGWASEFPETPKGGGPVDVTLEQIKKNEVKEG